jgi:hypothetical protein
MALSDVNLVQARVSAKLGALLSLRLIISNVKEVDKYRKEAMIVIFRLSL